MEHPVVPARPGHPRGDTASFFALGAFSGIASSCCAPVLADVMTLAALSGSPLGSTLLGLGYVFGMTFPLFAMALLRDRFRLGQRRWMRAKPVRIQILGRTPATNTVNVAVAFAVMGGFVIYLGNAGQMTGGPGFQVAIARFLDRDFGHIQTWTSNVPEAVLGLLVLALAARTNRSPHPKRRPGAVAALRKAETRRRRWHVLLSVAVVALVAGIVTAMMRSSRATSSSATRVAPGFTLPSTNGHSVSLADYRGRNVVLYFSEGAGCGSCLQQMAAIEKDQAAFENAGVTVLPIVMNTKSQIMRDMSSYGGTTPFLLDDGTVSREYGTLGKGMHADCPDTAS